MANGQADVAAAPVRPNGTQAGGPIVVLTYAHAGADLLREMLVADESLACTSGTGVIPLCHAALMTWQALEGRSAAPSELAVRSVRALAATMIVVIQAEAGASRWCETAVATPAMASSFLRVFPDTTVICLHRKLPGVLTEGIRTYPWGLGNSPFWAFAAPHPGNNVATIADYWVTSTEQLLAFEASHPDRSLRVRYEELTEDPDHMPDTVCKFLGLEPGRMWTTHSQDGTPTPSADPLATDQLAKLPDQICGKIGELHDRLGYPSPFLVGADPYTAAPAPTR